MHRRTITATLQKQKDCKYPKIYHSEEIHFLQWNIIYQCKYSRAICISFDDCHKQNIKQKRKLESE